MTRLELEDRMAYCQREIAWLREITPDCTRCNHHTATPERTCAVHGPIPAEFNGEDCHDWSFDDCPF